MIGIGGIGPPSETDYEMRANLVSGLKVKKFINFKYVIKEFSPSVRHPQALRWV